MGLPSSSLICEGFTSPYLFLRPLIKSGVVPQHPPRTEAPEFTSFSISITKVSQSMSYSVFPFSSTEGSPAFGFAIIGILVTEAIFPIISTILSGPVEQFAPIAHAPSASRVIALAEASDPKSVLPSASNVRVTITARSDTSFAAMSAALHS